MFTDDNNDQFMGGLYWVKTLKPYYENPEILLCPSARKKNEASEQDIYGVAVGGKFTAWQVEYPWFSGKYYLGSYGLNQWVTSTDHYAGTRLVEYLWRTPNVRGAGEVPLFTDASTHGYSPWHHDEPPEYDGQTYISFPICTSVNVNEMRAGCLNRHPSGTINCLFLDLSTDRVGLKQLWQLKWHRNWFADDEGIVDCAAPVWPEWMKRFRDYGH